MGWNHRLYDALNHRGTRPLLAAPVSVYASLKRRRPCRIHYDGAWFHQYPEGTIVEPRIHLETLQEIQNRIVDCWTYLYRPGEGDEGNEMCSKSAVKAFLIQNGFDVTMRESDSRVWLRDQVYGSKKTANAVPDPVRSKRIASTSAAAPLHEAESSRS